VRRARDEFGEMLTEERNSKGFFQIKAFSMEAKLTGAPGGTIRGPGGGFKENCIGYHIKGQLTELAVWETCVFVFSIRKR